jgi:hypothetical protein
MLACIMVVTPPTNNVTHVAIIAVRVTNAYRPARALCAGLNRIYEFMSRGIVSESAESRATKALPKEIVL